MAVGEKKFVFIPVPFLDSSNEPCWERSTFQSTYSCFGAKSEKHIQNEFLRAQMEIDISEMGVEHAVEVKLVSRTPLPSPNVNLVPIFFVFFSSYRQQLIIAVTRFIARYVRLTVIYHPLI